MRVSMLLAMKSVPVGVALPNELVESDNLWHYTDGTALLNIVEHGRLWATQIHYLNDFDELLHFVRMTAESVGDASSSTTEDRKFIEAVRLALSRADLFRVCVASFSVKGDDLSQWRGYSTHGNGYAVGFRAGDMKDWVENKRTTDAEAGWTLNPVLYDGPVKDALPYGLLNTGRELLSQNQGTLPALDKIDWASKNPFFPPALVSLMEKVLAIGPMLKHESFASEAEWRIYTAPLPRERLRFRPRGTMMLPYAEIAFCDAVPVREIVVGPGPHAALNRSALEVAFGTEVKISESCIPFRDW
jgi:hypothetical protein